MQHSRRTEYNLYAILLFLIWPLFSVLIAFFKYKENWAKNVVWLFVAFYGYNIVISNTGIDANRYRDQFIEMATTGTTTNVLTDLYAKDTNNVDLLSPLLTQVVALFTDNYKLLFLMYGLIFGYFFSRNLWLLLDRAKHSITIIGILLLVIFFAINPIWNINGFRFYAGAQIFVYGALIYFLNGKKSGIYIALTAVLVHFSFILPGVILLFYLLMGNRLPLYFFFFMVSLFITELNLEVVRENLLFISPIVFEERIEGYTNEEYKESITVSLEQAPWYVQFKSRALKYSIYLFLIALYWRGRYIYLNDKVIYKLFCFVLLFYGIANIISYIPSAGRFIEVASGFAIALVFLSLQYKEDTIMKFLIKLSTPALLLYLVMVIRFGFDTISLTTIFGNPLIALFMEDDMALIQFFK